MIGTGYKCDQCGYLEVGPVVHRYDSMATPPAGWLIIYVMVDDRDTSSAGHHFCCGLCARQWVLNQEGDGNIRGNNLSIKPPPEPEAQMMWGPIKLRATTLPTPYKHERNDGCKRFACVPYTDQDHAEGR